MAGIHDRETYAKLQAEERPRDDGSWPSYRKGASSSDGELIGAGLSDEVVGSVQDIDLEDGNVNNSDMHRAQRMINHLSIALEDLYAQGKTRTGDIEHPHVSAVKELRSDYRARNRVLAAELAEKRRSASRHEARSLRPYTHGW